MCGRFFIESTLEEILEAYNIPKLNSEELAKGEIFPGTKIPVIFKNEDRKLSNCRWGFKVNGYDKEIINGRIEGVLNKPLFKDAFYKYRCIIPANAFYEWKKEGKNRIKYKIAVKDKKIFSMAGLYDYFLDENSRAYMGVVILTRPSDDKMVKIHERMPVILAKDQEEIWLSKYESRLLTLRESLEASNNAILNIKPEDDTRQLSFFF